MVARQAGAPLPGDVLVVETQPVATQLVAAQPVATRLVATLPVATQLVEMLLVETQLVEMQLVETLLVGAPEEQAVARRTCVLHSSRRTSWRSSPRSAARSTRS